MMQLQQLSQGIHFLGVIAEVFNFFGRSLNRWAQLALTEDGLKKLKLKKLCITRWSSRIDAIRVLKNRYAAILKVLTRIALVSKENKEQSEASGLKMTIETCDFIVCIIIWERILTPLHILSQKLHTINNYLSILVRLLSAARDDLLYLRGSWGKCLVVRKCH